MHILDFYKRGAAHIATVGVTAAALTLLGCGSLSTANVSVGAGSGTRTVATRGSVYGGQQPIVGATILLFAAGTGGYGQSTPNLLTKSVTTDSGGGFNITDDYTCSAGQQMFLIASGGNPGTGANPDAVIMAALGDCAQLSATTFISANEVTTIGSVFALAPFMPNGTVAASVSAGTAYFALGSSSTNTAGLARAFASVNKLVNTSSGSPIGSALPANAVGPSNEINTLADVLATCINSIPGQGTCGPLFSYATSPKGLVPSDTLQAAINIAQSPTLNTASLYTLTSPESPFQPRLATAPADWTMAVKYKKIGLNAPQSATVDASGQVWFANSNGNTVTLLAQTGNPVAASPLSGNGLSKPSAVAIDATGNAWVANKTGNSVSVFSGSGSIINGSPLSAAGNLNAPAALAFDAPGNLWVGNAASLVKLSSSGAYVLTQTSGIASPTAIAINPK